MNTLFSVEQGGSIFFAALLSLIAILIAKRLGFFRLPLQKPIFRITLLQVAGIFIGYFFLHFLVAFLLLGIAFVITGEFSREALKSIPGVWLPWVQVGSIFLSLLYLCLYLTLIKRATARGVLWGGMGRSASWRRFRKDYFLGAFSLLVSYPLMFLTSLVAGLFSLWIWGKRGVEQVAVKQLKGAMEDPVLFTVLVVAVVFLIPFMEELLFRGFLQSFLRRFLGRAGALIVTAVLFAGVHFSRSQGSGNFELILSLFVLSCFLGFLYERQQTLWAPMGLHTAFNGLSVLLITLAAD